MEIIEGKEKVTISLSDGDYFEIFSLKDKIKVECIHDELFFNGVRSSVILEKSEEEKAIEAMKAYIEEEDKD